MKMQASLEFLLILSALAALSVSVIALYSKSVVAQRRILESTNTSTLNSPLPSPTQPDNPKAAVFLPVNSTEGRSSEVQIVAYGCASGLVKATLNSTSLYFANTTPTIRVEGIGTESVPFVPLSQGQDSVVASLNFSCGGTTNTKSYSLSTYAEAQQQSVYGPQYSAAISNRNESIVYGLTRPEPVVNITQKTFCTQYNFFYKPFPMSVQCGTTNGWYYFAAKIYTCPWSTTTCIYPAPTNYSVASITAAKTSYSYSFLLAVSTPIGVLHSNLNGTVRNSSIFLNNVDVGHAEVTGVSPQAQIQNLNLLENGSKISAINSSALQTYVQTKNNVYSMLSFYNGSGNYSNELAPLDAAINEYNAGLNSLLEGASEVTSCTSTAKGVYCVPSLPFSYMINLYISKSEGLENATMYSTGSEISLITK